MPDFPVDKLTPLTLGTANLGMAYGATSDGGVMDHPSAMTLLDAAWKFGIRCLDTAPAYGEAEARIGDWRAGSGQSGGLIMSKVPAMRAIPDDDLSDRTMAAARASIERLRTKHLDGYITHSADDFLKPQVRESLGRLKQDGLVRAIGASVYEPEQVMAAIETGEADIVQLPASILDRRMLASGVLEACHEAGVAVFVRSAFLQGVLLAEPDRLPSHLSGLSPTLCRLREIGRSFETPLTGLLLRFVRHLQGVVSVVVGVQHTRQLGELVAEADAPPLPAPVIDALEELAKDAPAGLLDPRQWKRAN